MKPLHARTLLYLRRTAGHAWPGREPGNRRPARRHPLLSARSSVSAPRSLATRMWSPQEIRPRTKASERVRRRSSPRASIRSPSRAHDMNSEFSDTGHELLVGSALSRDHKCEVDHRHQDTAVHETLRIAVPLGRAEHEAVGAVGEPSPEERARPVLERFDRIINHIAGDRRCVGFAHKLTLPPAR